MDDNQTDYHSQAKNLFVYPAESNFSGMKFPLTWCHNYKFSTGWLTLLDASAFISASELNLHNNPFDFVTFSFHKLFGYPTGLGVLLVRNGNKQISLFFMGYTFYDF